ncbi:MAG: IS21 family transposase [Methylotenera sp.]|nr:IS21 family transposase [Oligoflexia bacterium]
MIGSRKSTAVRSEIFRLKHAGHGHRKIAQILGISRNTVKGILKSGDGPGRVEKPLPETRVWSDEVAWDEVRSELTKRYVTIKQLAAEYAPEGVDYIRFWRELRRRTPVDVISQVRIKMQHEPGSRFEGDYCDGIVITDRKTGRTKKTQLFATASSFNDYKYAEFTMAQTKCEFIASQDRMFHFFGGLPVYYVIDNLKSGVSRAHRYDPDLNPSYCDYANHMGFSVLPARPVTPRDKPAIEGAIGVTQRQFYSEVRNRVFYSVTELNDCLRKYITRLNASEMKDYGTTRAARFETERPLLKALPQEAYEMSEYRSSKVHPDCHIQVDRNFYSVPYRFISQSMRVKLSVRTIEIYSEDHELVAIHARKLGKRNFSTHDAHYPEQKIAAARFDILALKKEAARIGPEMDAVNGELLAGVSPLRYLRRAQGILRLSKTLPSSALEYGCKQARLFGRLRLQYITDCATRFHRNGTRPVLVREAPARERSQIYLHEQP